MLVLVMAAGLVYGALLSATLIMERDYLFAMFGSSEPVVTVVLSVLVVPTLTTWLTAEVIHAVQRKRILDRRVRRRLQCAGAGVGAGVLGVLIGTTALVLLDRVMPDAVLVGLAAAAGTSIVLVPLRRQLDSECANCGYDLSGASPASGGVCTECGFDVMGGRRGALPHDAGTSARFSA
jgi:hypothetical protein